MWTFLKLFFIGILIMMGLMLIVMFPFAAIGLGIAVFCWWMQWYKAAIIIAIIAFFIQLTRMGLGKDGFNNLEPGGSDGAEGAFDEHDGYEDYDRGNNGKIGLSEAYVVYKVMESHREKKDK